MDQQSTGISIHGGVIDTLAKIKDRPTHQSTTHDEMYIHVHEGVHSDGIFTPLVLSVWDGKRAHQFIGGTVFFRKHKDENDSFWLYALARCSSNDNFDRARGRAVARRRFFETPIPESDQFIHKIDGIRYLDMSTSKPGVTWQPAVKPTYELAKLIYTRGW